MMAHWDSLWHSMLVERAGWTLVHFLWQGAAAAALLWAALPLMARTSARARYAVSVAALAVMIILPVATFLTLGRGSGAAEIVNAGAMARARVPEAQADDGAMAPGVAPGAPLPRTVSRDLQVRRGDAPPDAAAAAGAGGNATATNRMAAWMTQWRWTLPWVVALWAAGVIVMGIWHARGWLTVRRLRRLGTRAVDGEMAARFAALTRRLRISRPVRLLESLIVQAPMAIGWLRPVVLVPVGLLTGLSIGQLEALLAHELAHIRRHDYLVNLLQIVAETVLFYHPGVWWLSGQIRRQREHCCDDIAAELCANRATYAESLLRVAELCRETPSPALGATGGELLPRIARLLGRGAVRRHEMRQSLMAAGLALTLAALPLALSWNAARGQGAPATATSPAIARTLPAPKGTLKDEVGQALAGAKVILYYDAQRWGLDDRTVETVTTDSQGRFAFTQPLAFREVDDRDGDRYIILALDPAHALAWRTIPAAAPQDTFDLVATAARQVRVHVVDAEGKPVAGARVGISNGYFETTRSSFNLYSDPGLIAAVTDAQGQATVPNVPVNGRMSYRVQASNYAPVIASDNARAAALEIALSRAAVVRGSVMAEGQPVANAVVSFRIVKDVSHDVCVRTDATGKFQAELSGDGAVVFNAVRVSGDYSVQMSHPDFAAFAKDIHVAPGQRSDLTIDAVPGILLRGQLVERGTSKPVAYARVLADSKGGRFTANTAADGRFSWRVPGPEDVGVFFSSPPDGQFVRSDPGTSPEGITVPVDGKQKVVDFTLPTPGPLGARITVSGLAKMPDGTPASGVRVEAAPAPRQPYYWGRATASPDGSFLLKNAPEASTFYLYAQTTDRRFASVAEVTPPVAGPLVMTVLPTETADLLVTDAQGKPLANTPVIVRPSFGRQTVDFQQQLTTDGSGHLKADGILRGNFYQVQLAPPAAGADKAAQDSLVYVMLLPKDGAAPKDIVLSNLLPLRVVDEAGKTVPVEDIQTIEVEIQPQMRWMMGPKPEIRGRLEDATVLVDRENWALASPGNEVTMTFKTTGDAAARARAPFPDNTSRMVLRLLERIEDADVTAGGAGLPADIAADELAARLVDRAGKPVAAARVSFPDYVPWRPDRIAVVTTDQNGIFRVPHIPRFLYAQIDAPGYARRWLTGLTPGKGATITLDNTTRLRGKVVGADAKPVSGVEILLETSRPRPAEPDFPIPHLQLTTQTDAQGAFDTLAEPGEYELFATGPDGLFARIPKLQLKTGQTLEQAVTLAPGVHLRIKAVSSITNQPVAGAKFVIWKELPFADLIAPGSERTTNVDGIADWQSVMPGIQSIDVTSPEYARWGSSTALDHWYPDDDLDNQALRLDLKPGMADVLVKMEPAMHVTGKVIDAAGKPVPDVYVNVEGFQTGDRRYMRQTNAQGQYDLYVPGKWINGGLYHVAVARTPNYQKPSAEGPPFAPKPGGQAEFTVKLE